MNMASSLKTHSHGAYGTEYEVVLATHRCRQLLTPRVRNRLERLIGERVSAWEGDLHELSIEPDHVRLSLGLPPTAAIADFVGALKTGTSRRLRNEFIGLKKRDRLWAKSYCVVTTAGAAPGAVDAYLQEQR